MQFITNRKGVDKALMKGVAFENAERIQGVPCYIAYTHEGEEIGAIPKSIVERGIYRRRQSGQPVGRIEFCEQRNVTWAWDGSG